MLVSVIVTTYNWPNALKVCLEALKQQTNKNFEVIVADDGSKDDTRVLISEIAVKYPVPLGHVWQEDLGFRAATIRNKAIAAAKGELIVFLDGDCVPLPTFIANQLKLCEAGYFLVGNRILLSEDFTKQVLLNDIPIYNWGLRHWLLARLTGKCNRLLPLLKLPIPRKLHLNKWQGAKGCNLSIWKQDLIAVKGWDESFVGWGYEDSDLVIRLIKYGIKRKDAKFSIPVLHLWHKENTRACAQTNWQKLQEILKSPNTLANIGLEIKNLKIE